MEKVKCMWFIKTRVQKGVQRKLVSVWLSLKTLHIPAFEEATKGQEPVPAPRDRGFADSPAGEGLTGASLPFQR